MLAPVLIREFIKTNFSFFKEYFILANGVIIYQNKVLNYFYKNIFHKKDLYLIME